MKAYGWESVFLTGFAFFVVVQILHLLAHFHPPLRPMRRRPIATTLIMTAAAAMAAGAVDCLGFLVWSVL